MGWGDCGTDSKGRPINQKRVGLDVAHLVKTRLLITANSGAGMVRASNLLFPEGLS